MSLDLNARQRAMLSEMGLRLWWPQAPAQLAAVRIETDARAQGAAAARAPTGPASLPAVATDPGWTALAGTLESAPLANISDLRADWLLLDDAPDDAPSCLQQPGSPAARLLDNMLKALGLQRVASQTPASDLMQAKPGRCAYLSLACKSHLLTASANQLLPAAGLPCLQQEIKLLQPKIIVAMGRAAMKLVLAQQQPQALQLPLGKLRGQVWRYQGLPVLVTYSPAYLLGHPLDKARAWEDWCLAAEVLHSQLSAAPSD